MFRSLDPVIPQTHSRTSVHVQTHISVQNILKCTCSNTYFCALPPPLSPCAHFPNIHPFQKKTLEPIVYLFLFFSSSRMTHLSQLSKPGKKGFKVILVLVGRQVSSDSLVGVDRRQQRRNGSKDTLHCDALVCSYSMQPGLRAACPCA